MKSIVYKISAVFVAFVAFLCSVFFFFRPDNDVDFVTAEVDNTNYANSPVVTSANIYLPVYTRLYYNELNANFDNVIFDVTSPVTVNIRLVERGYFYFRITFDDVFYDYKTLFEFENISDFAWLDPAEDCIYPYKVPCKTSRGNMERDTLATTYVCPYRSPDDFGYYSSIVGYDVYYGQEFAPGSGFGWINDDKMTSFGLTLARDFDVNFRYNEYTFSNILIVHLITDEGNKSDVGFCFPSSITEGAGHYSQSFIDETELAYQSGKADGLSQGITQGKIVGYNTGYADGLTAGSDYSFTALISSVIDVPVNAFMSLFSFDFLGVNIANFILSLFTLAIVLMVLKKII